VGPVTGGFPFFLKKKEVGDGKSVEAESCCWEGGLGYVNLAFMGSTWFREIDECFRNYVSKTTEGKGGLRRSNCSRRGT